MVGRKTMAVFLRAHVGCVAGGYFVKSLKLVLKINYLGRVICLPVFRDP